MADITFDHVTKSFSAEVFALDDLTLHVPDGQFLILVGPSGCGKTTALRIVAGLERPTIGEVRIGEVSMNGVSPRDRDIAMVFQNYALYPHMTVFRNLAFGLRERHTPKDEIKRRVQEVSTMLGLEELLKRRPAQLSGGQRQRVAMGRALVREPKAFLMDEPLSNLDAKLRVGMRAQLSSLHTRLGTTTVYVTHDQVEAMTLGHRVAVMRNGRIQQIDTPQALYNRPENLFVAAFIGSPAMNLVEAAAVDGSVEFGGYRIPVAEAVKLPPRVIVGIRPEAFSDAATAGPTLPTIDVTVDVVEELGADTLVIFTVAEAPVDVGEIREASGDGDGVLLAAAGVPFTARLDPQAQVRPGATVALAVDPRRFHFFDPDSGARLELDRRPASLASAE